MKKIITIVMAGIIAASMTGCASMMHANNPYALLAAAALAANTVKTKNAAAVTTAKQGTHAYAKALVKLGDDAYAAKSYERALKHYDDALRDWEHYVIYKKIAYCLVRMGNTADAKLVYKKALKMAPGVNKNTARGGDL